MNKLFNAKNGKELLLFSISYCGLCLCLFNVIAITSLLKRILIAIKIHYIHCLPHWIIITICFINLVVILNLINTSIGNIIICTLGVYVLVHFIPIALFSIFELFIFCLICSIVVKIINYVYIRML